MNTRRQCRNWQELESQERVLITCEISQEHSSHQEHGLLLSAGSPKECSLQCYAPGSFQKTPAVYSDIMLVPCLNPKPWTIALGREDLRESGALQDSGHDHDSFLLQIIPPVGSVCFETEVLQIQVNQTSSFLCIKNYRKNKRVVHSCRWVLNLAEDMELSSTVLDNHTHGGTRMLKLITSYDCVPLTIFVDNNWIGLWLGATFQQLPPNGRKHFDLVEEISKKWWNYESSSQLCHSFIVLFCCKTRSRTKAQDANEEKKKNVIILLKIPMKRKRKRDHFLPQLHCPQTGLQISWLHGRLPDPGQQACQSCQHHFVVIAQHQRQWWAVHQLQHQHPWQLLEHRWSPSHFLLVSLSCQSRIPGSFQQSQSALGWHRRFHGSAMEPKKKNTIIMNCA